MDSIMLANAFDVSKVTFGNIKSLDNGGKTVYIGYNGKPLIVQTPEMAAPFGSTKWNPTGGEGGKDKYTLEMSFKGVESRPYLKTFMDLVENLDEKIIESGLENSQNWFKKKYNNKDVVGALYTPMLKRSKDKETGEVDDKYPPTFRINLPFKDDKFDCDIYNTSKEQITLSNIDKGSKVTAILQCMGIWVAGGKFGCSWKVIQLRVVGREEIRGFSFIDDGETKAVSSNKHVVDDDDYEDDHIRADIPGHQEQNIIPATEMVESSDDEGDDPIDVPVKKAPLKKISKQ